MITQLRIKLANRKARPNKAKKKNPTKKKQQSDKT